jgi:hypothetical protein
VHSLSLLTGIEAFVVTHDICELNDKEAKKMLRWTARALVTAAVSESVKG